MHESVAEEYDEVLSHHALWKDRVCRVGAEVIPQHQIRCIKNIFLQFGPISVQEEAEKKEWLHGREVCSCYTRLYRMFIIENTEKRGNKINFNGMIILLIYCMGMGSEYWEYGTQSLDICTLGNPDTNACHFLFYENLLFSCMLYSQLSIHKVDQSY